VLFSVCFVLFTSEISSYKLWMCIAVHYCFLHVVCPACIIRSVYETAMLLKAVVYPQVYYCKLLLLCHCYLLCTSLGHFAALPCYLFPSLVNTMVAWLSTNSIAHIKVILHCARLVLGWVTVCTVLVFNQPPRPTQPGHSSVSRYSEYCHALWKKQ